LRRRLEAAFLISRLPLADSRNFFPLRAALMRPGLYLAALRGNRIVISFSTLAVSLEIGPALAASFCPALRMNALFWRPFFRGFLLLAERVAA